MHAAVIGFGAIGRRHATNIRQLWPQAKLTIVRRDAHRDEQSDALNAQVIADVAAAVAQGVDFAVVATPSALHLDSLTPLFASNVPCYVEKPAVTNVEQLHQLSTALDAAKPEPITLAGCNFRFLPSLQRARELIKSGTLGRIVRASFQAGQWLPDWRPTQDYRKSYSADPKLGGGVILDLIHEIDAARWLLGEFDTVKAVAGRYSSLQIESEDAAVIALGAANGPLVAIGLDYVAQRRLRRYDIIGENGTLTWDFTAQRMELCTRDESRTIDCGAGAFDVAATYVSGMREFVDCVQARRQTSQDLRDGLRSVSLALRARAEAGL